MTRLILVFLFFSFVFSLSPENPSQQAFLSLDAASNKPTIEQIITLSRHGTSTQVGHPFVEGEWEAYHIVDDEFRHSEVLTSLGGAQCWSLGRNLATKYPMIFNNELFTREKSNLNVFLEQKTTKCSHYFEDGVLGEVTNIGLFEKELVKKAFELHGNCPNCGELSKFPFEKSQLLANKGESLVENQIREIDGIVEEKEIEFYDFWLKCPNVVREAEYMSYAGISQDDKKLLFIEHNDDFTGPHTLIAAHKHFYHQLENFGLSEFCVKLIKGGSWELDKGDMNAFLEEGSMLPHVHGLWILKDIEAKLLNGQKWIGYIAHNNNLIGVLVFLMGTGNESEDYYPFYASTAELVITKKKEEYFVTLVKDNKQMELKGCGVECPLETFKELLASVTSNEEELSGFCSS